MEFRSRPTKQIRGSSPLQTVRKKVTIKKYNVFNLKLLIYYYYYFCDRTSRSIGSNASVITTIYPRNTRDHLV